MAWKNERRRVFNSALSGKSRAEAPQEGGECGKHRAKDDPVALAILHFGCEVRRQVVFVDVAQQLADRAKHHHLRGAEARREFFRLLKTIQSHFVLQASSGGSHPG